jgi:hypothetical protein
MSFKLNFLFLILFVVSTIIHAESIKEKMNKSARDMVGEVHRDNGIKKDTKKAVSRGYDMYDNKGNYVGKVSKNQKCVFIGNYSNGEPAKYDSNINVKKLEFECR